MHPFVQRDFPEVRRDKFDDGNILDKENFIARACSRPSPLREADDDARAKLPRDLQLAIDHVTRRGPAIITDRARRLTELTRIAATLEPLRRKLDAQKSECAALIAKSFNAAWTAAVIDAMDWPDKDLPLKYVRGFVSIFDVPDSGVFKADFQPAEISREKFEADNTRMVAKISDEIAQSALHGDSEQRERRKQCWIRTKKEIKDGLVSKARSRARMDKKYGRGRWRCMGRNAILQKGKWRCIDNAKRSKHNKATTLYERITCGRADFPLMVSREFARRARERNARNTIRRRRSLRMRHGTNDLKAAYRHVPNSNAGYTCFAVWNDDEKRVTYHDVPGHNFGKTAAVVNFNRFPELATVAARRLLWCVTEHYYDDNNVTEPEWAGDSGQLVLKAICSNAFFGFPFDDEQDVPMHGSNEFLGVVSSLEDADEGILRMDVSRKRRGKLRDLAEDALTKKSLPSGLASSIFGKCGFMLSPCYGTLGRACLQPIKRRQYEKGKTTIDDEIEDSLEFIIMVCDKLPALELPVEPRDDSPVVIFTDAEGKKRRGLRPPSGHVGFLVIHPVYGRRYASRKVPDALRKKFDEFKQRDTYIGHYELVAAITPFVSLPPEWFHNRPVEIWIDNSGAIGGLLKGYSGVPDCAKIINTFHFAIARLSLASLYIDYVPTESNPADIPSRLHEMSETEINDAEAMLGRRVALKLPDLVRDDGEWLSSTEIATSLWGE
jgi:hypothetical protein